LFTAWGLCKKKVACGLGTKNNRFLDPLPVETGTRGERRRKQRRHLLMSNEDEGNGKKKSSLDNP